jgi:hypothetical protein
MQCVPIPEAANTRNVCLLTHVVAVSVERVQLS